jgi:hypothetical protein
MGFSNLLISLLEISRRAGAKLHNARRRGEGGSDLYRAEYDELIKVRPTLRDTLKHLRSPRWVVMFHIDAERDAQDDKWGEQNHEDGTGSEDDEQTAATAKAMVDICDSNGDVTWKLILWEEVAEAFAESDPDLLRAELVQVAAVAAQWVEAIDRRESAKDPKTLMEVLGPIIDAEDANDQ